MICAKTGAVVNGIAFVLLSVSVLFADAVVDGELDNNQNDFGYYWYYYDDNDRLGKDDRPQAAPTSTPSTILVKTIDSIRHAFGDMSDIYKIKVYEFTVGSEGDNRYATVPFTFGDTWKTSYGTAYPYVGVSTMLCKSGGKIDLSGASSIKFKIRSHKNNLSVRFMMQTKEIQDISEVFGSHLKGDEFGYYGYDVNVSTSWEEKEIKISDLKLPGAWARDIPFNIKSATKLAWEVNKVYNPDIVGDTIDIDDIVITDYYWVDPILPITIPPNGKEFATFDKAPYNETPMRMYWDIFNDKISSGNSVITKGAGEEYKAGFFGLAELIENSGYRGRGLLLEGNFGKPIMQSSTMVNGYFGMGFPTSDSAKSYYWNAKSMGITSIYFNYFTRGNETVTLEIRDKNDVSDADNPTKRALRGPDVVWHIDFPGTQGKWRQVAIPFNKLTLSESAIDRTPLDPSALARFDWKLHGPESQQGKIVIDNVYFLEGTSGIIHSLSHSDTFFKASYVSGIIHIMFDNMVAMKSCKVKIYNAQGKLLMINNFDKASAHTMTLPVGKLTSGLHFLIVQGIDANGKAVNTQRPINIVR